jgi:hypothetical protein
MYKLCDYLALNSPGRLIFEGSETARLFTREIEESLSALISKSLVVDGVNRGFVHSSADGRPWTGTMWTRDAGNILREFVHYGYLGYAGMVCEYLIEHCGINEKGFYAFPEYLEPGGVESGDELDGACAIIISFCLFFQKSHGYDNALIKTVRGKIKDFLTGSKSPARLLIKEIEENKLISGTGEFGGGMGTVGAWCNVVQNHLAVNALCSCGKTLAGEIAANALAAGKGLIENIKSYLIDKNGFIWCVSPKTLKPDENCLNVDENVGFSGINGCGAMMCDIDGGETYNAYWKEVGFEAAEKTFLRLLSAKGRKEQFLKYGMYLQFETYCEGLLTSPSYGQGYALQLALNLNKLDLAEKLFNYLVNATFSPPPQYRLTRDSGYWFYERFLSPDYFSLPKERQTVDEGCGALNVVNVAEPLKIARQLAGLTKVASKPNPVKLPGISKVTVENWLNGNGEKINAVV